MKIRRLIHSLRSQSCTRVLCLALALGGWFPAHAVRAEIRAGRVRWVPSPSSDITGYELSVGVRSGDYAARLDLGLPNRVGDRMEALLEFDDGVDVYLALRARAASGLLSDYSNEIVIPRAQPPLLPPPPPPGNGPQPAPTPDPPTTPALPSNPLPAYDTPAVGIVADPSGAISWVEVGGQKRPLVVDELATLGRLRPAWCDLDGDGELDLLIGLPPGGGGKVVVLLLQNQQLASRHEIDASGSSLSTYSASNGETYPACGDLDGDGRNEVAVGLGPGELLKLHLFDDFTTGFSEFTATSGPLTLVGLGGMVSYAGTAIPALGDFDGDGIAEIAIGGGVGSPGRISIFDDALNGFAPLRTDLAGDGLAAVRVLPEFEGLLHPAAGDLDADGVDEILIGLGRGGDGRVFAVGDAGDDFAVRPFELSGQTAVFGSAAYRRANGEIFPSLADIDGDGRPEVGIGFGEGGDGLMLVFDDVDTGFALYRTAFPPAGLVTIGAGRGLVPALRPAR